MLVTIHVKPKLINFIKLLYLKKQVRNMIKQYINLEIDSVFQQIVEERKLDFHTTTNKYRVVTGLTLNSETNTLFD